MSCWYEAKGIHVIRIQPTYIYDIIRRWVCVIMVDKPTQQHTSSSEHTSSSLVGIHAKLLYDVFEDMFSSLSITCHEEVSSIWCWLTTKWSGCMSCRVLMTDDDNHFKHLIEHLCSDDRLHSSLSCLADVDWQIYNTSHRLVIWTSWSLSCLWFNSCTKRASWHHLKTCELCVLTSSSSHPSDKFYNQLTNWCIW